ncbi:hypothetical protein AWV79_29815 [Cupriavidus sp. UYMMa02A]|nr:hypothetical protein AWV79_29815 [Cupriavidus sp. UYMMa02A]
MSEALHSPLRNNVIRNGALEPDTWQAHLAADDTAAALPPDSPGWLVTLQTWQTHRQQLRMRQHAVAVYLPSDADPEVLLEPGAQAIDPVGIAHIAIDFPVYTDGRGYSLAQLLRTQYGWHGELRAVGDVMIDTVHYLARCGFDSFAVKPGHDPEAALAALKSFTVHYQRAYRKPLAPVTGA